MGEEIKNQKPDDNSECVFIYLFYFFFTYCQSSFPAMSRSCNNPNQIRTGQREGEDTVYHHRIDGTSEPTPEPNYFFH